MYICYFTHADVTFNKESFRAIRVYVFLIIVAYSAKGLKGDFLWNVMIGSGGGRRASWHKHNNVTFVGSVYRARVSEMYIALVNT